MRTWYVLVQGTKQLTLAFCDDWLEFASKWMSSWKMSKDKDISKIEDSEEAPILDYLDLLTGQIYSF